MNDIIINKIQSIQRCVERAREELKKAGDQFENDFTRQDAAILNMLRACEQTIDLANHIIKSRKMGIPTSSTESFKLLANKSVIPLDMAGRLERMVHFHNTVIHEYQRTDMAIVRSVIQKESADLLLFAQKIKEFSDGIVS
jgi:uncharacterized protein YutE (UPF0331/DUF86 family)